MFVELYHTTQTAALSGGTSSQLAIYSMNTEISPISDFTCILVDRLSLSHPCQPKLVPVCVCTAQDEQGTLPHVHCSNASYANHQMLKDKYNPLSV